jgi:adenylate cyclase
VIFLDYLPSTIVGLMAVGLAGAFCYADPQSPTTRALALTFAAIGGGLALGTPFVRFFPDAQIPWFVRALAVVQWVSFMAFCEWMLRVARTAQPSERVMRGVRRALRGAQALTLIYLAIGVLAPAALFNGFIGSYGRPEVLGDPLFWLLAVSLGGGTCVFVAVGVVLFLQRIDQAERVRAIAVALAAPFMAVALVLPEGIAASAAALGIVLFMVGMLRYLVAQGERSQFLGRFLAPQVAQLVRSQGMAAALQPKTLELSVVCCDLRGFTIYASAHPSEHVIELLREYYDAVGDAVAGFGATIKDYVGDGILILVGAPLPVADHARQALALARAVQSAAGAVARRWSDTQGELGLGVGVASGVVTVGTIGSTLHTEYTAVGLAVNLASRLCEEARGGEILVDARTAELAGRDGLEARAPLDLKGFQSGTAHYALGVAPGLSPASI